MKRNQQQSLFTLFCIGHTFTKCRTMYNCGRWFNLYTISLCIKILKQIVRTIPILHYDGSPLTPNNAKTEKNKEVTLSSVYASSRGRLRRKASSLQKSTLKGSAVCRQSMSPTTPAQAMATSAPKCKGALSASFRRSTSLGYAQVKVK